ncbi:hypothetical protein NLJ89_g2133 [Agrocybe chaxingu]|uniref:Uncharacterized protein n=1 Tax=Agrocybe chaxingu TaxID=84603 RepID=A0A9W8K7C5_9AGAR|nr:hypothetical protein NLJ89_g2133 [Agrocybe chaxingu]
MAGNDGHLHKPYSTSTPAIHFPLSSITFHPCRWHKPHYQLFLVTGIPLTHTLHVEPPRIVRVSRMDHEEHVLNLSDVVHDETIDDESPHDVDGADSPTDSRPSDYDAASGMLPLHDNYNVSEHSTHSLGSADSYSVEMLEREIATLLNHNASAASAALLNAAAQQRQASIELGREPGEMLDSTSDNISGLGLGLSGLAAVLQAVHAQGLNSRLEDQHDPPKEQKTTRTAPAFHSLTASETFDDPSGKRKRVDGRSGSEGSDYLFTEERQEGSDGEDFANPEGKLRHSSSPHRQTEDSTGADELPPVPAEFSDINDILNQLSAQFEPDASHEHAHELSPPDSPPPVIAHEQQKAEPEIPITQPPPIPVLAPSNRAGPSQPVASTSYSAPPPETSTKTAAKRPQGRETGALIHIRAKRNIARNPLLVAVT